MSNKAISLARKVRCVSSGARQQLVLMADHANDKMQCWPGQQLLADDQGISVDTVQRRNDELEDAGLIKKEWRANKRRGGRTSNLYTLTIKKTHFKPISREVKPQQCGLTGGLNRNHAAYTMSFIESSHIPRQGGVSVSVDILERWHECHSFMTGDYAKADDRQTIAGIIKLTREYPDRCANGDGNITADEIQTFIDIGWLRNQTYAGAPTPRGKWLRITDAGKRALDEYEAMAA